VSKFLTGRIEPARLAPSQGMLAVEPAWNCDTAVALADATGGGVLLAKNSDRQSHEAQRLIGVPALEHPAGTLLRCQYLAVPQVARTAALIGSQPYWLWGFEHGLNEHGVAIGNEAIHTRETPQETGLLGMDLVRLGLERGATARQALDAMTALLEAFGQGGSTSHHATRYYDNSFLIADPREAWVLETSGRRWVARHLTRGAYALSNLPTIGTAYDLASDDLVSYAEDQGWWPRGRRPFHFAEAYTDPAHPGLPGAVCRLARSQAHLGSHGRLTLETMLTLLRDHGSSSSDGPGSLPWPDGSAPATVCMHGPADGGSTAASMVAQLTPGAQPLYWGSMAPPCTGVFLPYWVDAGPPDSLACADETPSAASPWWRFRGLWEAVAAAPDPGSLVGRMRQGWLPLEQAVRQHLGALANEAPVAARRALSEDAVDEALRVLGRLEAEMRRA
jgi:secernin